MQINSFNRITKIESANCFDGWDYTGDGAFEKPLVKKRDKQLRNKLRRRIEKKATEQEAKETY